jgi:hypothetical protein
MKTIVLVLALVAFVLATSPVLPSKRMCPVFRCRRPECPEGVTPKAYKNANGCYGCPRCEAPAQVDVTPAKNPACERMKRVKCAMPRCQPGFKVVVPRDPVLNCITGCGRCVKEDETDRKKVCARMTMVKCMLPKCQKGFKAISPVHPVFKCAIGCPSCTRVEAEVESDFGRCDAACQRCQRNCSFLPLGKAGICTRACTH